MDASVLQNLFSGASACAAVIAIIVSIRATKHSKRSADAAEESALRAADSVEEAKRSNALSAESLEWTRLRPTVDSLDTISRALSLLRAPVSEGGYSPVTADENIPHLDSMRAESQILLRAAERGSEEEQMLSRISEAVPLMRKLCVAVSKTDRPAPESGELEWEILGHTGREFRTLVGELTRMTFDARDLMTGTPLRPDAVTGDHARGQWAEDIKAFHQHSVQAQEWALRDWGFGVF